MDNLAHSLAGAALAEAGLKERSGLALPTLIIAANLPDIDVIGLLFGENLAFRRGITHGPLGLLLLPPLLAGVMVAFDRWQALRGKRPTGRLAVRFPWLVALAYAGALTHPLLDYLNTYGIRCLAPFSNSWFYGDTLFIVDVWMWTLLTAGVVLSQRRRRRGHAHPRAPAALAVLATTVYVGAMAAGSAAAERATAALVSATSLGAPDLVVASPPPFNPLRRETIYRARGYVGFGEVVWRPDFQARLAGEPFATRMYHPLVDAAADRSEELRDFLFWSRVPFASFTPVPGGTRVTVNDARYSRSARSGGFAVDVLVPGAGPGETGG